MRNGVDVRNVVAHMAKVEVKFTWGEDVCTWHFGSVAGARKWVQAQKDVEWYAIEDENFILCDGNDADGMLYIGVGGFEFVEADKKAVG